MDATTETTTTHDLTGWDEEFMPGVRSLLFGLMVERSIGVIERYRSDLFHDAAWITKHVNGEMSFYWGPRSYGTFIGLDPSLAVAGGKPEGLVFYRVDVHKRVRDGKSTGMWCATFTVCDPIDCEVLTLPPQSVPARDVMRLINGGYPTTFTYEAKSYRATGAAPSPHYPNTLRFLADGETILSVPRDALLEIDAEINVPGES